jgi:hypothetical protein
VTWSEFVGWKVIVLIAAWNVLASAALIWTYEATKKRSPKPTKRCPKCGGYQDTTSRDGSILCWCDPDEE